MARIKEVRDTILFGLQTKLMWIDYYLAEDSTDTSGLGRGYDGLVKGIGLYRRQSEGWVGIGLKGAVINGVLYGDTTTVGVNELLYHYQPEDFQLYQNYPNPFNPATTITYQLPKDGMVTLKVYDMLGTEVANLVNEKKIAGKYEVKFNASNLASGVYIYWFNINEYVSVKKMVLLR